MRSTCAGATINHLTNGQYRAPMRSGSSADFDGVEDALRRLGATEGAPEAHGCLCGLACFFGARAGLVWRSELLGTRATAAPAAAQVEVAVLDDLVVMSCDSLVQGDMSLMLLLPPDERPLSERTTALAEWCAGFMYGLGEAAGHHAGPTVLGSTTMREIISDFGEIARVAPEGEESDVEAETAYSELVEFVRVSVQLVFEELHELRATTATTEIH